jgi:hypothetical protein
MKMMFGRGNLQFSVVSVPFWGRGNILHIPKFLYLAEMNISAYEQKNLHKYPSRDQTQNTD